VIRKTNLVLAEHDGEGYLVALAGESEWVRNVRAAGGRVVLGRRGQRRAATLVEVPVKQRARSSGPPCCGQGGVPGPPGGP
jgi:hypothetical protein